MNELPVHSDHAIFFSSGLNHAGGKSMTVAEGNCNEYMYQLFVYIVSDEVDYPAEVGTKTKLPDNMSLEVPIMIMTYREITL
jgi:hypothetical protein